MSVEKKQKGGSRAASAEQRRQLELSMPEAIASKKCLEKNPQKNSAQRRNLQHRATSRQLFQQSTLSSNLPLCFAAPRITEAPKPATRHMAALCPSSTIPPIEASRGSCTAAVTQRREHGASQLSALPRLCCLSPTTTTIVCSRPPLQKPTCAARWRDGCDTQGPAGRVEQPRPARTSSRQSPAHTTGVSVVPAPSAAPADAADARRNAAEHGIKLSSAGRCDMRLNFGARRLAQAQTARIDLSSLPGRAKTLPRIYSLCVQL